MLELVQDDVENEGCVMQKGEKEKRSMLMTSMFFSAMFSLVVL